jgi:HD-like signal output (HDOD) protein
MPTPTKLDPNWLKAASARLPSSAKLIDALYKALQQPDVDMDHVVRLISMDTAISSRLLRMANSATYTRGEAVTSLDQALSWLGGFQAYRAACVTVSAKLCEQNLPVYGISADRLLANSIAMAVGMEVLTKQTALDPKTGYTIGLLHNLGRIVLQRLALQLEVPAGSGDLADMQQVLHWERETFGCSHTEVGASVLKLWGMSALLCQVLEQLHDLETIKDPVVRQWSSLLHVTATVVGCTEFGLGVSSDAWSISDTIVVAARLPEFDLLQLSDEITVATKALCEQSGLVIHTTGAYTLASVLPRPI